MTCARLPPPPYAGTAHPFTATPRPYAGSLTVSGGSGPYVWTVLSGALPAGLSLDPASGTVAGQSAVFGSFAFVASVRDVPSGAQATASATLVVAPRPVTITTTSLPHAIVNESYSVSLAAVDGAAPLRWSVVAGAIPPGLSLDPASGVLSGTPQDSALGTFRFTISVTDSWTPAQTAIRAFTISATRSTDRPGDH